MIQFDLPQNTSSIIKIVGVGGGGGNAVNYMYNLGIDGVDFIVCNTDQKALNNSSVPTKIQLGPALTQGLGAGANPEIGMRACQESINEIENLLLDNTKMVFVTAGMGGGTGTGGAPIVAKVSKDLGILTVGIVTTPFSYEGKRRKQQAEAGIASLRENVDTILVISNDKLRQQFGNIPASQAFSRADDILATATKCITDVINSQGHIVVDFADVSTVMRNGGVAILGSATARGENRAYEAVEQAINSPLLNDDSIKGAKWVLLNINSAHGVHEHTLDEVEMIQAYVQEQAGDDCDVIFGTGFDDNLGENISVTIIATGFDFKKLDEAYSKETLKPHYELTKEVYTLKEDNQTDAVNTTPSDSTTTESSTSPEAVIDPLAPTMFVVEPPAVPNVMAFGMRPTPANPIRQSYTNPIPEEKIVMTLEPEVQESITTEPAVNSEIEQHITASAPEELPKEEMTFFIKEETISATTSHDVQSELDSIFSTPAAAFKPVNEVQDDYVTLKGITINRRKGNRMLTDSELEAEVNFELQKRAFEDRASKLRSMSFNVNKADINADEVNIPAFMRQNQTLENHPSSSEDIYSNLNVTKEAGNGSNLSNLNSFLNGKNPD
jgi:cell division protein FtsZ